ncbi:putative reverse transcriptase domain-containing protein [Tanacetum coccineum]|uniref:Reverse transcriptase domain-containing protein n=1 Tax=Tanacetum coccineum TaxID=301880 RepID=A0ABQ5D8S4_9ASTR
MTPESIQAMIDQALLRNSTNGDGSHSSHGDNRRNVQTARPCFYADFMKCQPLNFKGTEGVVGLTRWIEKMESVFNISGCAIENQVKFATCTLLGAALTWWNGQIRTLGPEAYAMTWEGLKKKMTDKYCPLGEIQKLEIELWNLKVKGNDVPAYTERFQELTLICTKFCANETEKINKYIRGLPDNIYGNVKSSKPKRLDETIELANDLMDQKLRSYAEKSDNKKKADDSSRCNHGHQQQPFKWQNVAKVYNMETGEKKPYGGSLPKVQFLSHVIDRRGIHVNPAKIESIEGVKFDWGEKEENAFQLIKQKLYSTPILALLEGSKDFMVYCDASHKGLGVVLMQREKVIAYASRQLKNHEKNYTTHDLELGSVVIALKIWIHYLYGTKCAVFTDHKSLQHIPDQKELNMRQRRWLELLNLPKRTLEAQIEAQKPKNLVNEDMGGMIRKDKPKERLEPRAGRTLCLHGRSWLPCHGDLGSVIMHESHKSKYSIHPGSEKMCQDVKKLYWWPNMKADIATYVRKCLTCTEGLDEHQSMQGLFVHQQYLELWKGIFITLWILSPNYLCRSHGFGHPLGDVDRLYDIFAHFLPIRENDLLDKLVRLYLNRIVARHEIPVSIIWDRDGRFTSNFWKSFQKALGIDISISTDISETEEGY